MLNNTVITDIRKTKKGFNALFTDSGFLMSIDDVVLSEYHIEIGSLLTRRELNCVMRSSQNQRAVDKALVLLSYRMHSQKELYDKLLKFFDEDTSHYAVNRMTELGYLNDAEYAQAKADYLINSKKYSVSATKMKLYSLGIDKNVIDNVILLFDTDNQTDVIIELLQTKYRSRLSQPEKVIASLARKGFRVSDIRKALRSISTDIDIDIETEEY